MTDMIDPKFILEVYNALPVGERTTRNVHRRLVEQGHSVCFASVRDVLCATCMSNAITADDVRITVRTLTTALDILSSDVSYTGLEPDTDFAAGLIGPLESIVGSSASDLVQPLARVAAEYFEYLEVNKQLNYIEQMNELRRMAKLGLIDDEQIF
ncbi:hypothetical protein [Microvirga zambiensis]|uniref:hypothetical protein n=1 Tax=Microvirga zambiensis TaxID=1402137 RepID=UPI00191EAD0E|nr:hypothetical protein [Microvirga zambiensis]